MFTVGVTARTQIKTTHNTEGTDTLVTGSNKEELERVLAAPFAQKLQLCLPQWKRITNNPVLLKLIEHGASVPLTKPLGRPVCRLAPPVHAKHRAWVQQQLLDDEQNGIVEKISEEEARTTFCAPAYVIHKEETGKRRLIIDFREVNKHFCAPKTRSETLAVAVRGLVEPGVFFTSLDVKSAFCHVPLTKELQQLLTFNIEGAFYRCLTAPFGFQASPYLWGLVMKEAVSHCRRSLGVSMTWYVDDCLIVAPTKDKVESDTHLVQQLMASLGITLSVEKSQTVGTQSIVYLGLQLESRHAESGMPMFSVTEGTRRKLRQQVHSLLRRIHGQPQGRAPVKTLAQVAGKVISLSLAANWARMRTRALYDCIKQARNWNGWTAVSLEAKEDLQWILAQSLTDDKVWSCHMKGVPVLAHKVTLWTDASSNGWGGVLQLTDAQALEAVAEGERQVLSRIAENCGNGCEVKPLEDGENKVPLSDDSCWQNAGSNAATQVATVTTDGDWTVTRLEQATHSLSLALSTTKKELTVAGSWDRQTQSLHIGFKELLATRLSLQAFLPFLRHTRVLLLGDNSSVTHIVKAGCSRVPLLSREVRKLWQLLWENDVNVCVRWVPTLLNRADAPSRLRTALEWSLRREVFQTLCHRWFTPEIDLFASARTAKLPRYGSLHYDPQATVIDALSVPWSQFQQGVFLNPPFALIPRVLQALAEENGRVSAILIVPRWPTQWWYQRALSMASDTWLLPPTHTCCVPLPLETTGTTAHVHRGRHTQSSNGGIQPEPLRNRKWRLLALCITKTGEASQSNATTRSLTLA